MHILRDLEKERKCQTPTGTILYILIPLLRVAQIPRCCVSPGAINSHPRDMQQGHCPSHSHVQLSYLQSWAHSQAHILAQLQLIPISREVSDAQSWGYHVAPCCPAYEFNL